MKELIISALAFTLVFSWGIYVGRYETISIDRKGQKANTVEIGYFKYQQMINGASYVSNSKTAWFLESDENVYLPQPKDYTFIGKEDEYLFRKEMPYIAPGSYSGPRIEPISISLSKKEYDSYKESFILLDQHAKSYVDKGVVHLLGYCVLGDRKCSLAFDYWSDNE